MRTDSDTIACYVRAEKKVPLELDPLSEHLKPTASAIQEAGLQPSDIAVVNIGVHYPLDKKQATNWFRHHTVQSATEAFVEAFIHNRASMPFVVWRETSPQHYIDGVHSAEAADVVRKTAACVPELRESANAYNQVTSSLIESAHIPILKVSSRPVSSARAGYMLMLPCLPQSRQIPSACTATLPLAHAGVECQQRHGRLACGERPKSGLHPLVISRRQYAGRCRCTVGLTRVCLCVCVCVKGACRECRIAGTGCCCCCSQKDRRWRSCAAAQWPHLVPMGSGSDGRLSRAAFGAKLSLVGWGRINLFNPQAPRKS